VLKRRNYKRNYTYAQSPTQKIQRVKRTQLSPTWCPRDRTSTL